MKRSRHITGNMGLYYVCFKLSELGWNVIPQKCNTNDPNIAVCWKGADKNRKITVQTRSFSEKMAAKIGNNLDKIMGDFWIIVTHLNSGEPQIYILSSDEVKAGASQDGDGTYWLEPEDYSTEGFKEKWDRIGTGF